MSSSAATPAMRGEWRRLNDRILELTETVRRHDKAYKARVRGLHETIERQAARIRELEDV